MNDQDERIGNEPRSLEDMAGGYIDSRDIRERIVWLEGDEDNLDEGEREELTELREINEDGCQTFGSEWGHDDNWGVTLVPDGSFEDYARETAESIGAIEKDMGWPCNRIDWEAAADDLKMDYASFDIRGETYWGRG